jgi:hypothetical protein
MTINEAITKLRAVKDHGYDDKTLVGWISELEALIYHEIVVHHEGSDDQPRGPYSIDTDMDTVLFVPDPYSDVYVKYLETQIDYHNREFPSYNNSAALYNKALSAFAAWYIRNNMPKQRAYIRV